MGSTLRAGLEDVPARRRLLEFVWCHDGHPLTRQMQPAAACRPQNCASADFNTFDASSARFEARIERPPPSRRARGRPRGRRRDRLANWRAASASARWAWWHADAYELCCFVTHEGGSTEAAITGATPSAEARRVLALRGRRTPRRVNGGAPRAVGTCCELPRPCRTAWRPSRRAAWRPRWPLLATWPRSYVLEVPAPVTPCATSKGGTSSSRAPLARPPRQADVQHRDRHAGGRPLVRGVQRAVRTRGGSAVADGCKLALMSPAFARQNVRRAAGGAARRRRSTCRRSRTTWRRRLFEAALEAFRIAA